MRGASGRILLAGVLVAVLLGAYYRFLGRAEKAFWYDETYTALRVSGHTEAEAVRELWNGTRIVSVASLAKYQVVDPARGVTDSVRSLAQEENEHAPLYYALVSAWARVTGSSPGTLRTLSGIFSLLSLAALYALALELFRSRRAALLALAFGAVSPFFVIYAQEAREYSLISLVTLLSGLLLLRALRRDGVGDWAAYAGSVALCLNTSILSAPVLLAHGLFVLVSSFRSARRSLVAYGAASAAGALAFLPWLLVIRHYLDTFQSNTTLTQHHGLVTVAKTWLHSLVLFFFDVNLIEATPFVLRVAYFTTGACVLGLLVHAALMLGRPGPDRRAATFLALTLGVPLLLWFARDLAAHQASAPRYVIGSVGGLAIVVGRVVDRELDGPSPRRRAQLGILTWALVVLGLVSSSFAARSRFWRNKGQMDAQAAAADVINRAARPLVVFDGSAFDFFVYAHLLRPDVRLLAEFDCDTCRLSDRPFLPRLRDFASASDDVFLLKPSESLLRHVAATPGVKCRPLVFDTPRAPPTFIVSLAP